MRMFDAFGTISSITAVSISRRGSLRGGSQSQDDADGKLGEHFVKIGTLIEDCLKAREVFGGVQINAVFVAVYLFLAGGQMCL